ncbi:hypothetical protein BKA63DRAFT_98835 [Paraphoma chrysanthemicola]|nr:hypothetical protein BKA63DRAFT_98835 [Paraphoma chrysanthemicola]
MADPASILGLISASLTITIRAATILSVHVAAVRVAARLLSSWLEEDAVGSEEVEDVKTELLQVLSACCSLLSDLQDHVAKALAGAESVAFKGAVTFIWDEDLIKETMETLHHQETALVLILQTLGQLTRKEQRIKLQEHEVVQTLQRAKRPSSSIFGIRSDNRSSMRSQRLSYLSEKDNRVSISFTFDMEVMASSAYRNAFTSLLKRNIVGRDQNRSSVITSALSTEADADAEGLPCKDLVGAMVESDHITSAKDLQTLSHPSPTELSVIPEGKVTDLSIGSTEKDGTLSPTSSQSGSDMRYESKEHSSTWQSLNLHKYTTPTGYIFCQALYDYEADDPYTLSFREGDIIHVITILSSGWHDGVFNGVRGWFPENFTELIRPPS